MVASGWSRPEQGKKIAPSREAEPPPELFSADGDEVELHSHIGPPGSPHLLLLHGLEGSLRSHYSNGILSAAADAGWSAHLLVFRSCGENANLTRRYHSGDTADARSVIRRVIAEFPDSQLCLAGVSLGGNVLLKFLGEDATSVPENVPDCRCDFGSL